MALIDRTIGAALAVAAAAAVVWASNVPMTVNASGDAVLRLAWGARPERIETCRDLSAEELSNLPQHMRQERICEGVTAEYRLVVTGGDGGVLVDRVIRGGGLRQDRRLYVFEELPVPAGPAAFDVRFDRITQAAGAEDDERDDGDEGDEDDDDGDDGGEPDEEDGDRRGAVPPSLSLAVRATAAPRQVILVTYDAQRRELVAVTGPSGS